MLNMASIPVEDGGMPVAWVRLMRVQLLQRQRLEAALLRDHDLTLAAYDVLLQLSWAPEGRLRPVDIARRMVVAQSGITRLLGSLERRGLVRREAGEADGRVRAAVLTEEGWRVLGAAAAAHVRNVDAAFTQHLSGPELDRLAELLARLPGGDVEITGPHPVAGRETPGLPSITETPSAP